MCGKLSLDAQDKNGLTRYVRFEARDCSRFVAVPREDASFYCEDIPAYWSGTPYCIFTFHTFRDFIIFRLRTIVSIQTSLCGMKQHIELRGAVGLQQLHVANMPHKV